MKEIGKYNLFKSLSLLFTLGPTSFMIYLFKDVIVKDSNASISVAGMIGILFAVLFLKNKIAENFKLPSPFIVATALFVIIVLIESVLIPAKYTCLVVMISCGIDEISFKRIYQRIEMLLPEKRNAYKHLGFYFCKTETIIGDKTDE